MGWGERTGSGGAGRTGCVRVGGAGAGSAPRLGGGDGGVIFTLKVKKVYITALLHILPFNICEHS